MKRPGSRKFGSKRIMGAVLAAGMLAAGTYAFTASNSVPTSNAGDGAAAISGYTVTNVDYTPNPADPTTLSTYTFTLSAAAEEVYAKTVAGQATWDTCVGGALNTWTCTPSALLPVSVLSMDNLRVIATQ